MAELLVVGGERMAAAEGTTFDVVEPATAEPMAEVAEAGPEDARRTVDVGVARRSRRAPGRGRARASAAAS